MDEQTVFRYITRGVAVVSLLLSLVQLLSLPNDILSLVHYVHLTRTDDHNALFRSDTYFLRDYGLRTTCRLISFGAMLWVALSHIRLTRRVRAFYGFPNV